MARSDEDIINIELVLHGRISIDLERVQNDPIWRMMTSMNIDGTIEELLREYFSYYILRERLLSEMPSTNGPGDLILKELKNV